MPRLFFCSSVVLAISWILGFIAARRG